MGQKAAQFIVKFGFGQGLLQLAAGRQIQQQCRLPPQQLRDERAAGQHAGKLCRFGALGERLVSLSTTVRTALQDLLPGAPGLTGQRFWQIHDLKIHGDSPLHCARLRRRSGVRHA